MANHLKPTNDNTSSPQYCVVSGVDKIEQASWQALVQTPSALTDYHFFKALEESGSASAKQGWQAEHLVIKEQNKICGILPCYQKTHSWGEYVFDWAWADAYQHYGFAYYPKLVSCIPFTPVPSDKLLSQTVDYLTVFDLLTQHCKSQKLHSWHLLFCPQIAKNEFDTNQLNNNEIYERNTVQFHWFNQQYLSFEHYLSTFTARKRKNTRKERLAITEAGITIRQLTGNDLNETNLAFFYLCYQLTYLKKGHQPHLTVTFFKQIWQSHKNNLLLVIASKNETDIACSLFFYDQTTLYGRYWGCTEEINFLHFELCYYQGIDFCIKQGMKTFNPGTQGEHKIHRGFIPVLTYSYHWIAEPQFKGAIAAFCQREQAQMQHYFKQCQQLLPFNDNYLQTYLTLQPSGDVIKD